MGDLLNQMYVKRVQKEQQSIVFYCVLPLNDAVAFFKVRFFDKLFLVRFSLSDFQYKIQLWGGKKNPEHVLFF